MQASTRRTLGVATVVVGTLLVKCMCAKSRGSNCNVGAIGRITMFFLTVAATVILFTAGGSAASKAGLPSAGRISSCAVLLHSLEMGGAIENDIFLRDFPYDAYLDNCDVGDFTRLERDRGLLNENGRNGDKFVSNLFKQYILRHPPNPTSQNDVIRVFELADRSLAFGVGDDQRPEVYETIGYMLLDDLDNRVKLAISTNRLAKSSRETQYLLKGLTERGYIIGFRDNWWEKLIKHFRKGDWSYIWKRLQEEMMQYCSLLLITFAVLVGLLLMWRLIPRRSGPTAKVKSARKRSTTAIIFHLLLLVVGGFVHDASAQTLQDETVFKYYEGDMVIKRLYYGSKEIGSTIWLRRGSNKIRAKYFASGQVYQKYSDFKEKIVLVCSGAFSIHNLGNSSPQGLTVDNGKIINHSLDSDMDGLVIVYPNGGIVVSDITKDWLNVEDDRGKKSLYIPRSEDKTTFLHWAERNDATVFQTQLLASNKGLRLNVGKARKELRERRFLAIVQDRRGEVIHIIINVTQPFYLGQLAQLAYDYLLQTGATVFALLNLDTGDYDILQVKSPTGVSLGYPVGPKPISGATNLLVYYYAK